MSSYLPDLWNNLFESLSSNSALNLFMSSSIFFISWSNLSLILPNSLSMADTVRYAQDQIDLNLDILDLHFKIHFARNYKKIDQIIVYFPVYHFCLISHLPL